jgi:hypothetical protein
MNRTEETNEQKGMRLFFDLLKNKVITTEHDLYHAYWDNEEIKACVSNLARQSGTVIIAANSDRMQLLSKATGSTFATNFTHLKSKYKTVSSKKEFQLISMIIMTYLAHIDGESYIRNNKEGMTFFAVHEVANQLFKTWEKKIQKDVSYAEEHSIAMAEIVSIWSNLEVKNEQARDTSKSRQNKKSRMGFIQTAMNLLKEEGLVYIADADATDTIRAIPKDVLYERLWEVYHNQNRYVEIKNLIDESKMVQGGSA